MQHPKNEGNRKIRKLLSPKRLQQLQSPQIRSPHRQLPDKRAPTSSEHLSMKHRQALGSRKHTKNSKEEGPAVTRRQTNVQNRDEIRMEYEGYSQKQKNTLKFRVGNGSKSHRTFKSSRSVLQRANEDTMSKSRSPSIDFNLLTEQLREYRRQNRELQARNKVLNIQLQHTGDQLRMEHEARVKQMEQGKDKEKENQNRENDLDRTVVSQSSLKQRRTIEEQKKMIEEQRRMIEEQKRILEELNLSLKHMNVENEQLVKKIKELNEKERLSSAQLQAERQAKLKDREAWTKQQKQQKQLSNKLLKTIAAFERNQQNQRKVQIERKEWAQKGGSSEEDNNKIRQLEKVIAVHSLSLANCAKDVTFLEGRVDRWKGRHQKIMGVLQGMNQNCISVALLRLNQKYST